MSLTPEIPLQPDIFSGEKVDTRTAKQKQADRQRVRKQTQPQQAVMFNQREIGQFGVKAHPLLPLSPHMKLPMILVDPRSPEEIEQDLRKTAEEQTYNLFDYQPEATKNNQATNEPITVTEVKPKQSAYRTLVQEIQVERSDVKPRVEQVTSLTRVVTAALCAREQGLSVEEIMAAVQVACYAEKPAEPALQSTEVEETDELVHFAVGTLGAVITPHAEASPLDFTEWLESPTGQEVQQNIRRRAYKTEKARFDEPDDVMQRSLIWLWEQYEADSNWFAQNHAGYISKAAVRSSKCKYTYRNYLLKTPTECAEDVETVEVGQPKGNPSGDTSIRPHDKGLVRVDQRLDLQRAFEASAQTVIDNYRAQKNRNRYSTSPERVEEMLHIIWEGLRDHYEGKNGGSGKGSFATFCKSKGMSEQQAYRWRDKLLVELQKHLQVYQLQWHDMMHVW